MNKIKMKSYEFIDRDDINQVQNQSEALKIFVTQRNKLQEYINDLGNRGGLKRTVAQQNIKKQYEGIQNQLQENLKKEENEKFIDVMKNQQALNKERDRNAQKESLRYQKSKDFVESLTDSELENYVYDHENLDGITNDTATVVKKELRSRNLETPLQKWGKAMHENDAHLDWLHTTSEGKAAKKQLNRLRKSNKNAFVYGYDGADIGVSLALDKQLNLSPLENLT